MKHKNLYSIKKGIKLEMLRAFGGRSFWIVILAGCIYAIVHFITQVLPVTVCLFDGMNMGFPRNTFNNTMVLDTDSYYATLFYYAMPVACVIPHALSYYHDLESGYVKSVYTRMNKIGYLTGKYVFVFLTAGLVCVIPIILNLLLTMAVLPSMVPQEGTGLFTLLYGAWQSKLFFTKPFVYVGLYLLIDFLYYGSLSCMVLGLATLIQNRYLLLFTPFVIYFLLEAIFEFAAGPSWAPYYIVCPQQMYRANGTAVIVEILVLLVAGISMLWIGGGRHRDTL